MPVQEGAGQHQKKIGCALNPHSMWRFCQILTRVFFVFRMGSSKWSLDLLVLLVFLQMTTNKTEYNYFFEKGNFTTDALHTFCVSVTSTILFRVVITLERHAEQIKINNKKKKTATFVFHLEGKKIIT